MPVTVDEIEARHPGIFGPHGGYSRALSIASMSWTLGSFVGPIISGWLAERFGYYEMNCVLGLSIRPAAFAFHANLVFPAVLCLLSGINTFINLDSRVQKDREIKTDQQDP